MRTPRLVRAQMQFDMYHHYTVDEHSIRAIGLLGRSEKGGSRTTIRSAPASSSRLPSAGHSIAVLLHDIAKGRGGDHSILGAEVAGHCPRLGMSPAGFRDGGLAGALAPDHVGHGLQATSTTSRRSSTLPARCRAPSGCACCCCSPSSTSACPVGPGVWNGWKRQLLADLYDATEEVLRLGHGGTGRTERIAAKQERLAQLLRWDEPRMAAFRKRMTESYWIAEPADVLERNARQIDAAGDAQLSVERRSIRSAGRRW